MRLALHKWTLNAAPLADALRIAQATGWEGIELRRDDFNQAIATAGSAEPVMALLKGSGLAVACVGVERGWIFAEGEERKRLLSVFAEQCARARALDCPTVMSPADLVRGDFKRAAASLREVGDIAAEHGVTLGIEFMIQAEQFNSLDRLRELLALAGHPRCGVLIDSYHFYRGGTSARALADLEPGEVVHVQYSDVPNSVEPGKVQDRLPPGEGVIPFADFFAALADHGYAGYLSYEVANPAVWARDPEAVAREGLEATRALLPRSP